MAEEGQDLDQELGAAPEGQKNPLLSLLVILNTLLIGAVAYFQYTGHQKMAQTPNVVDVVKAEMKKFKAEQEGDTGMAQEDTGKLLKLDGFTANLAQGDGPRRFIRLNIFLKFTANSDEQEYTSRVPQIRDSVIGILNSKRPEDLMALEGKNFLKNEIKSAINGFLINGDVIDVYYVSFQIN